jgi:hypothetical protein
MRESGGVRYREAREALDLGERRLALVERIVLDLVLLVFGICSVVLVLLFGLGLRPLPTAVVAGLAALGRRQKPRR